MPPRPPFFLTRTMDSEGNNMCQSPLLSLAMELILAISSNLNGRDLKCVRLTCKYLAEALAHLVLRHINTAAKRELTITEVISDIQDLVQQNHAVVFGTRQITIKDLPRATSDEEEKLKEPLLRALTSLKGVETVIWYPSTKLFQETMWKAILGFGPNLLHLTIHAGHLEGPLDEIQSLIKLESISFLTTPWEDDVFIFSAVSNLYASSTTLKSITIERDFFVQLPYPGLHHLFSCPTNMSPGPRHLRHLQLTDCFLRLDEITLPHLINLTSLKLSARLPSPDLQDSPEAMWTAFKVSGIHLEHLELAGNMVAASLVDYLSTYSGLKKLRMNLIGSAETVNRFWSIAFPNHIHTLEDFALYTGNDGEWCCFAPHSPLIVQCTKLKYLVLSIAARYEHPTNWNLILDNAKTLIDMAVTDLPLLEHLYLQVASPDGFQGGPEHHVRRADLEKRIGGWIPSYKPPDSCQYLPLLSVGRLFVSPEFIGIRDRDTMNFAYVLKCCHKECSLVPRLIRHSPCWKYVHYHQSTCAP